jgi:hypothetical protein
MLKMKQSLTVLELNGNAFDADIDGFVDEVKVSD